jgi:membrane protease YdiL (CAAX protease family)
VSIDDRQSFLNLAGLMQGGLIVVALLLAWLIGLTPLDDINWSWADIGWSVAAVPPLLVVFFAARGLRDIVVKVIGRPLSDCTWYDLMLLAIVAGFSEELLFRGVLQPWIGRIHPWTGVVATNVIFGLMHAVTPAYAVIATGFGFYLSWLYAGPDGVNLLRPMITHAVYDYIAFLLVVRDYRRGSEQA